MKGFLLTVLSMKRYFAEGVLLAAFAVVAIVVLHHHWHKPQPHPHQAPPTVIEQTVPAVEPTPPPVIEPSAPAAKPHRSVLHRKPQAKTEPQAKAPPPIQPKPQAAKPKPRPPQGPHRTCDASGYCWMYF